MKKIILFFAIILGVSSCSNYLDINTNPQSPSDANLTSSMIFPGAEMKLAASYGDYLRIIGGYLSEQYSQDFGTSNYLDYSKFTVSATRSSGTYTQLFFALKNLETVREKATASSEWGTYLAATTLRAFTFQTLVDMYGEIPYTESLDISNSAPKYDDGKTVYVGILSELDDAISKASTTDVVCTNFLFGTTTADEWIKFANALKLRILMRMSNVDDVKDQLSALISENNFPTSDVSYHDIWSDEKGQASPFYQEEYASYFGSTQINVVANLAYMQTMRANDDPRYKAFFNESDNGEYTGGISGTNFSVSASTYNATYFCRPVFSYNMPVYLISLSEIEFFKAEYYARYGSAVDAKAHYEAAIRASFESAGLSDAEAVTVYNSSTYAYNNANYAKLIGIQKWIALGGINNFEAWCELRRLKYPAFGSVTGAQLYNETTGLFSPSLYVAGTLYSPINVNSELGNNEVLQRIKYAEQSSSTNKNTPDNVLGNVKVFWANY